MLECITPLILTYNEAPNISRTLEQLTWAKRIVVIDSYSTDDTLHILRSYPQVEIFKRKFDTHTLQWNYGLERVNSEWVLSLDADYILSKKLVEEIKCISPQTDIDGYFINFEYCVFGKPLRGTILPPRQALFRKSKSIYIDDGHTQLLEVRGKQDTLKNSIYHDDRKPLSRWLWAQDRYMLIEIKKLLETPTQELSLGDKIRKQKYIAPLIIFFYCLILKGGIWDGKAGWYYAYQRMLAEILLSIRLIESENPNRIISKPAQYSLSTNVK
ncbi:glycosyltransferase family 2 protein [Calothrix sp. UHCC 0171]|uniref:glycosyltransferase family 2 protein n=1 Tax=Calothrix sp. UHCC 0171 TaxID=3110245 RepID=UPI003A523299